MTGPSFVERHGLRTDAQREAAARVRARIAELGLHSVRFAFADQHGLLRGKTLVADEAVRALDAGVGVTSTLLAKDTSHRTVYPVFTRGGGFGLRELQGAADVLMVADPTTFRVLPWAPGTGWVLCDLRFHDGRPVPYCTRRLLRAVHDRLRAGGHALVAGLEVEFHLFRLLDPRLALADAGLPGRPGHPPEVGLLHAGYQYLTELRYDQVEPHLEPLRRALVELGLPLRSLEIEFGPSQVEFTFQPLEALEAADCMVLLRSAIKQVARRHGLHASFMCRPAFPQAMSSGWHLHQSLRRLSDGANAFVPDAPGAALSPLGERFLAGLLAHAEGATPFTTPTVNGYKRYRPNSLAPDRVAWAHDNRAAMLRVLGGAGDAGTRIENRVGEPAANPYLYLASQIVSGLDGLESGLQPGPSADSPYEAEARGLPASLHAALDALLADPVLIAGLGRDVVDWIAFVKRAELARFDEHGGDGRHGPAVTEWEHREYFDLF
ncbi:MAG TPA: glutamine synthetase family protein [Burkholderiaceae bacterium]|nr:glutamine synthetase family protein [Burkholderiaceae bacterium]